MIKSFIQKNFLKMSQAKKNIQVPWKKAHEINGKQQANLEENDLKVYNSITKSKVIITLFPH